MATAFLSTGVIRSRGMALAAMLAGVALIVPTSGAMAHGEALVDQGRATQVAAGSFVPSTAIVTVTASRTAMREQMQADLSKGFDQLRRGRQEAALKSFNKVIRAADASLAGDSRPRRCLTEDQTVSSEPGLAGVDGALCEAHFGRGYALIDLGRGDLAEVDLRAATEMAPQNAHFANEYAELFKSRRDWKSAYALFEKAWTVADHTPGSPDAELAARALRGMGYAKAHMGDYAAGEELLERSLAFEPDSKAAKVQLAQIAKLRAIGS